MTTPPERAALIDAHLDARLPEFLDDTARLCAVPSVSAISDPPTMRACAALVEGMLRARGYEVAVIETPLNPVVVGRLRGASERTLLFYNHYDVQPPEPLALWETPPFEPSLRDGKLYARGAKDDKGEFVARLAAVEAVRAAHGGTPPCGVLFVVEGQEEVGSPHIAEFVRAHLDLLKCDGAVWEEGGIDRDGRPMNLLGVRGILGVELRVRTLTRDAHSGSGHALPNAAWRLLRALATLKDEHERVLIPGFYDDVRPPSPADVALFETTPDLEVQQERNRADLIAPGHDYLLGRRGLDLALAVFQPTCNIQGLTAGHQGEGLMTIIPAEASAKLDFRLVPDQDPRDLAAKLRAHLDARGFADVETHVEEGLMWPYQAPADDPLVALTSRAAEEVYGVPAVPVPLNGGSSPVYAFAGPLGNIPVVRAGVGYWDSRTHAPNEHVRAEDLLRAARHIARIVDGFAAAGRAGDV